LEEAREQRQRDRLTLERDQSLQPVGKALSRIAALREQGQDRAVLRGLPADPPQRLSELEAERARLEQRASALDAELLQRRAHVAAFDDRARMLVAQRDDIVRLVARSAACGPDRARTAELEGEIQRLERELDEVSGEVLERSWRGVSTSSVEALPIELLRDRVARARPAAAPAPEAEARRSPDAATFGAVAVGVAILTWGVVSGSLLGAALGTGLSAVALTLRLATARARQSDARSSLPRSDAAQADLRALLAHVPVRAEHLEHPGEALVVGLARLQAALREREQRTLALDATRGRLAEADEEAARLARALRLASPHGAEAVANALDADVRRAERLQDAAAMAERDLPRFAAERHDVAAAVQALDPELVTLRAVGEELASGNARAGLELAKDRLAAHRRADQLEEELEHAHPNLDDLRTRLRAEEGSSTPRALDDEQLALTRARLEALEQEIEELVKASEALGRDAAHLRELETVDAVDSEIATLREAEAALARERDRKWLLARLLREADRRFREEHQPDLLRRASSYLGHLTGGRYERLVVDERPEANLFQVVGPGIPAPISLAPPVSTGTLEQAYLSLRLAIVDHLDQGGERLPLFIDEVFVNWDRERRAKGLEVLAGMSSKRQVFVFTCHEGLAEELRSYGARILSLEHTV
jgi:uncharacterized protein YhaN